MRLILALLLLLCGCSTYDLGDQYPPLTKLVDRPNIDIGGRLTTVNNKVYVRDLDGWLESVENRPDVFHAVMSHEQVHGKSQANYPDGWQSWIYRYMTDAAFMRQEELNAYYAEIKYYLNKGYTIDREGVIKDLSSDTYRTIYGENMISEVEAARWVDSVLNGTWTPQ